MISKPERHNVPPKSWYHHLTIDLLVRVLSRSIFHPAITMIFYLCIAAMHKHRQPIAYYTLYWAAFLTTIEILAWLNHRITYGPAKKVDWESEVVVITGGSSGLGRALVNVLVQRGVKVGVLDLKEADEEAEEMTESGDLVWQVCDVTDLTQVTQSIETIKEQLGRPTVLINNAATPINGLPILPSPDITTLTPSQATQTLTVNTRSHFNTLSACLPHLTSSATTNNGAHVITISSILSHLAPANLSDYTASKSAVSTLHHTLTHELALHPDVAVRNKIKTLLVEVGQMETSLFQDMNLPWYANFFGPVLDTKDVADEIVKRIWMGQGGVLRMPFYARCVGSGWYAVLPGCVKRGVRWWSGIDGAMGGKGKRL